jgi:hypothetical protein
MTNVNVYQFAGSLGVPSAIVRDWFDRGLIRGYREQGSGERWILSSEFTRAQKLLNRLNCPECHGSGYVGCGSSHVATCLVCQ